MRLLLLAVFGFFAIPVHAHDSIGCPITQAADARGQPMYFREYVFADGSHDLVMAASPNATPAELKRVTFGSSKDAGCHYAAVAIAKGGDWGWHLAWADSNGLFYARMDGVAWVSSPPKRLSASQAQQIKLDVSASQLKLVWQEDSGSAVKYFAVVSDDEGRNWEMLAAH